MQPTGMSRGLGIVSTWVCLIALLLPVSLPGANFFETESRYLHRIWQTENNIPNPMVRAIFQSRDGYLWLATEDGLCRFDGVRFVVYEKKTIRGRPFRWMVGLTETQDGSLWCSSVNGGLLQINNDVITTHTTTNGLLDNYVLSLREDSHGTLWIGTAAGLCSYKNGAFLSHTNTPGLSVEAVRSILEDRQGRLWVGTATGLSRLENGQWTTFTEENLLVRNAVMCLMEDRDGVLWVGTSGGLTRVVNGKPEHFTEHNGLAHNAVRAILQDASGTIWIGTQGGLQIFANGRIEPVSIDNPTDRDFKGIPFVYSLCEDREGSVWAGSNWGLNRLRPTPLKTITAEDGLPNNVVTSVLEDRRGDVWIGTYGGGVCRMGRDGLKVFGRKQGLPSDNALALYEFDGTGAIWVGTDGAGICRILHDKVDNQFKSETHQDNVVHAIYKEPKGRFWLATNRGTSGISHQAIVNDESLSENILKTIVPDADGIWFAGEHTLLHVTPNRKKNYALEDGFPPQSLNAVMPDGKMTWIGADEGLFLLKNGKFHPFLHLPIKTIVHVIEDDLGHLWFATRNGVFAIAKRELLHSLASPESPISIRSFGKNEGMRRAQCNGIGQPAGWKSRDGRIWFPTLHGVAVFDPKVVRRNQQPPPVIIEAVLAAGQPIPRESSPKLKPHQGNIEFQFTALSFVAPERVSFKYKLEGVDQDWIAAGPKRSATYTPQKPGQYRFRVTASNEEGVWNETGASFDFTILPQFNQTRSFYALCGAGALAGVAGLFAFRSQQNKRRERELMRQVDIHTAKFKQAIKTMESFNYSIAHDLRAPLRAIRGFTQALEEDYAQAIDDAGRDYTRRIHSGVERMDALISDLLAFGQITHKEVTLGAVCLETAVTRALDELQSEINRCRAKLEIVPALPVVQANQTLLHQVLVNLFSNAMKFVPEGTSPQIRVWAERKGAAVRLHIQDNGIGIEPAHHKRIFGVFERLHSSSQYPGTGIGLAIVQKAIERMDGKLGLESHPGRGSCFWIELPPGR